jgi:hypothetical protein
MMQDAPHAVLFARPRDRACSVTLLPGRVAVRGAFRQLAATQTLQGRLLAEDLHGEPSNCDPSSQVERAEGRAACDRPAQTGEGKANGAARSQRRPNRQSKP